jgi:hypothetical protein
MGILAVDASIPKLVFWNCREEILTFISELHDFKTHRIVREQQVRIGLWQESGIGLVRRPCLRERFV